MRGLRLIILFFFFVSLTSAQQSDSIKPREIATHIDEMPEFPGGPAAMSKYILKNLELPAVKENPPNTKPMAKFVVNADGRVSDITIIKSSGNNEIDKAVMNVIAKMPDWKPAKLQGRSVNCYYNLPVPCILYK